MKKIIAKEKEIVRVNLYEDLQKINSIKSVLNLDLSWADPKYNYIGVPMDESFEAFNTTVTIEKEDLQKLFQIFGHIQDIAGGSPFIVKEAIESVIYAYSKCNAHLLDNTIICTDKLFKDEKYYLKLEINKSGNSFVLKKSFINKKGLKETRTLQAERHANNVHIKNESVKDMDGDTKISKNLPYYLREKYGFELFITDNTPTRVIESREFANITIRNGKKLIYANGSMLQYPISNYRVTSQTDRLNDTTTIMKSRFENVIPQIGDYSYEYQNGTSYLMGRNGGSNFKPECFSPVNIPKKEYEKLISEINNENI